MKRRKLRIVLAVLMTLTTFFVCGIFTLFIFTPKQADALTELKSLPPYPGAGPVTLGDNIRYEKAGTQTWSFKNGGPVGTNARRSLNITLAIMTFDTNDDPDSVQRFYGGYLPQYRYYEVEAEPPNQQYLRYEDKFGALGQLLEIGSDNDDRPFSFRNLTITATKTFPSTTYKSGATQVSIELSILDEKGGIR